MIRGGGGVEDGAGSGFSAGLLSWIVLGVASGGREEANAAPRGAF